MDTLAGSSPDWGKCGKCVYQDRAGNAFPCINCTDDDLQFVQKAYVGWKSPEEKEETMARKERVPVSLDPLASQVGGDHYQMPIQPIEFIVKNDIPYREGNAIKYICRHKNKNGKQDIEKAIHYLQMILRDY